MDDADVVFVCEELCACRVCLATDVKLVVLYPGPLAETYEELTGMQVSSTDGLPQYLCTMCAALLKKSAAFRYKCHNTHEFLLRVRKRLQPLGKPLAKVEITMSLIRNLDRKYLKLPYITTNTITINRLGDITNVNENETLVEQATQSKQEEEEYEEDYCIPIEDSDGSPDCIFTDEESVEVSKEEKMLTDFKITKSENSTAFADNENVPKSKRKHVIACKDEEINKYYEIREYLIKTVAETYDESKKLFYNYLLNKYFYKTKESNCAEEYDVDSDGENNTIIKTVDKSDISENAVAENKDLIRNKLIDFVKEKYVNKTKTKRKKNLDLTRVRVGTLKSDVKVNAMEDQMFEKMYNFDVIIMTRREQVLELEQARKTFMLHQTALTCEECFKVFKTEALYKHHLTMHDPIKGNYICEVCRHRLPTSAKLTKHLLRHKKKYVCRQCKQSFNSSTCARDHYISHLGIRYECQHCGAKFKRYCTRMNHIRIHHGATECDVCYERFHGTSGVTMHKAKAHKQTYQCVSCDVHFENADAITRHIVESSDCACDPSIRACAKCGELCPTDEQFDSHVATHRGSKPKRLSKPGSVRTVRIFKSRKCCYCDHSEHGKNEGRKVPKSEYNIPKSEYSFPKSEYSVPDSDFCPCGDNRYACVCPKGTVHSCRQVKRKCVISNEAGQRRWAHKGCCEERRLNRKKVMCEICAFTCRAQAALRIHQLIHTNEKPFQCDVCSKRFRLKTSYQMHINAHTGERPFKCSLCPKAFKTQSANYKHQLVHTKERAYSCEVCGKSFQTSSNVKLHVQTVHMKIPQPRRVRSRKRKIERTDSEDEGSVHS